ncbi:MAG: radical SAM protein [Candidatus Dormiibacterota bacterium]
MTAQGDRRRVSALRPADVARSFDGPVGAYVHVPFCEWICPFCPYNKVVADDGLARRYFAALRREVDWYVEARGEPFTSLYIGGGTPTLYPDDLAGVIERIPVSGERAVEILPTHATPERLDRLAAMGITAVSIGAQSFHDEVLRRLGRPHDAATSRAAVQNALGRFACVDVDLIVDVAWESDEALAGAFVDDVRACLDLGVDQVSTYPLMRFGYTPFGTARHDRRLEHSVLAETCELAGPMGYERRSVWTLNRRESASYTSITRRRYLGMGAGSSSFAGRDFYVNHFGVVTYAEAVEQGRLPVARWLHLGKWAGAAYDAFWQAYAGGVDLQALTASYGPWTATAFRAGLAPLVPAGLLRRVPGGYRLTGRGFNAYHDLERLITYQLIEPLWAEMLQEHTAEPGAAQGRARWVNSEQVRSGRAWSVACRLFER